MRVSGPCCRGSVRMVSACAVVLLVLRAPPAAASSVGVQDALLRISSGGLRACVVFFVVKWPNLRGKYDRCVFGAGSSVATGWSLGPGCGHLAGRPW